jgi:hypothetical protein
MTTTAHHSLDEEGIGEVCSYRGMSRAGTEVPRYEPMIVRASPVMVSGAISAVCSGEGSPAVTATMRLDDINEAMDQLADGRAVRQIIEY